MHDDLVKIAVGGVAAWITGSLINILEVIGFAPVWVVLPLISSEGLLYQ